LGNVEALKTADLLVTGRVLEHPTRGGRNEDRGGADGPLHQTAQQTLQYEDVSQGLHPFRLLDRQGIDEQGILEEMDMALDGDWPLVFG